MGTVCGRYSVMTEEDILEMREILEEINRRYAGDPRLAELRTGETVTAGRGTNQVTRPPASAIPAKM